MIKIIILIILLTLLFRLKENFAVNPNDFLKDYYKIDHFFRNCLQKNSFYNCVGRNPYKKVFGKRFYIPKRKKIWYLGFQKPRDLLPSNI